MTRVPFDPKKTAAWKAAQAAREGALPGGCLGGEGGVSAEGGVSPSAGVDGPVRTVKQVNAEIQRALAGNLPAFFLVQGEISNFRVYDRGHGFFTLKEPGAELPCVMWKEALGRLRFVPKDGMAVIARGPVRMYEPQGKVQLYVEAMFPQGMGALELAYRQLCEKLRAEGLFEAGRKRRIPRVPERVVIITSRTGDVLHDVLTTAQRRFPGLYTMLYPVPVQGETAAGKIVEALRVVNAEAERLGGVDLILLVRGGGSLEDLWAFNEERVARAIVASKIPVATGIGHEPDTTIADLVGDLRGPTPTGVTELTIPDAAALVRELEGRRAMLTRDLRRVMEGSEATVQRLGLELVQAFRGRVFAGRGMVEELRGKVARIEPRHAIAQGWRRVEEAERDLREAARGRRRVGAERVAGLGFRLERASPRVQVQRCADQLEMLEAKLGAAMKTRLAAAEQKAEALGRQLRAVGPGAVLERGYSLTLDAEGKVVRSKEQVRKGDVITTRVGDGEIRSTVGEPRQGRLF